MLLRFRLVLLGLFCFGYATSQNLLTSPRAALRGQVWRLDEAHARQATLGLVGQPDESWFTELVGSYPSNRSAPSDLPPGHYLLSRVIANQVEWTFKQVPGFTVYTENDDQHLMVKVIDFSGKVVEDALVLVGKTVIMYDPKSQTYKAGPETNEGLLEIHVGSLVQFYQLNKSIQQKERKNAKAIFKRWIWRPIWRWVVKPVYWTVRLPYDVVYSIVKKRPTGWPGWVYYRSLWAYRRTRHLFEQKRPVNFMLTHQPKYRPGDTVKVKAYITDLNGHPLRRPLQLLFTDRNNQTRTITTVKPKRPGIYFTQFILHDSLQLLLDRDVTLAFDKESKWKGAQLPYPQSYGYYWDSQNQPKARTSFHYEDYELNQVTFKLRAENNSHWRGKKAVFFLEAKDMNGLTVPDARGKLVLQSKVLTDWQADRGFLPDTLWSWSGNLDASGETRLEVPLDRFPAAAFSYTANAECRTSDNELKTATQEMTYLHDRDQIVVKRNGDSLRVVLLRAGKEIVTEAELQLTPQEGTEYLRKRWVTLPTTFFWPPNYIAMSVKAGPTYLYWTPTLSGELKVYGQHDGDSLSLFARSNDSTSFTFHLFEGDHEIGSGITTELNCRIPAKRKQAYHLVIHRIRDRSSTTTRYTYHWRKRDLKLEWQGPATIYPGMTADMRVQVRNARNKPVRKADVTAYAINSRFENYAPPSLPSASKPAKPRKSEGEWNFSSYSGRAGRIPLEYQNWAQRAGLDTLPWYHFLYPDSNVYTFSYPIESGKAEIAPFVVRNGAIQPVQIVYIDYEPVYFAWATPNIPYSFSLTPGRHRIELRLPDFGIKIDTFTVRPGFKTILSMDPDHLPRRIYGQKMTAAPLPPEKALIDRLTVGYRGVAYNMPSFLETGGRLLLLENRGNYLTGPIRQNAFTVDVTDNFRLDLVHETGFEYEFGPKLVKMRTFAPYQLPQTLTYSPSQLVEHRPWIKDSIVAQWRRSLVRPPVVPDYRASYRPYFPGRLTMLLDIAGKNSSQIEYIALMNDPKNIMHVIPYYPNRDMTAPFGKWAVAALLTNDRFVLMDSLEVKPYGRNYYGAQLDTNAIRSAFSSAHPEFVRQYLHGVSQDGSRPRNCNEIFIGTRRTSGETHRLVGRVFDQQTGEGLPFATVICKGFGRGTAAAEDGSFAMDVPDETDTLEVICLGYKRKLVPYRHESRLDIGMEEESVVLEQIEIRDHHAIINFDAMSISSSDVVMTSSRSMNMIDAVAIRGVDVSVITGGTPAEFGDVPIGGNAVVPEFPQELLDALAGKSTLRKDFRDNAVWEPNLRSDRKGMASFRVKFPEDITRWDAYALAVDRHGRTGITKSYIRSWKPIAGRLAMPRFFYEGDTAYVIGKVMNYTGDTIQMRRTFKVAEEVLSTSAGKVGPVQLDTLAVMPTASQDSFTLSYMADKSDGYGDGEQWGVRVFRKGLKESDGLFATLVGDSVLAMPTFDPAKGDIQVRATSKFMELLIVESNHLSSYEHLCNEQLSSRLIAVLTERKLFRALGREWHGEEEVRGMLAMLQRRLQPQDQGWGWWPGMKTEIWVSAHVMQAVTMARLEGYAFDVPAASWSVPSLEKLNKAFPASNLEILRYVQQIDSNAPIKDHIAALDTFKYWSVAQQVAKMELRQKAGMSVDLDSLMRLSRRDIYGSRYWGNPNTYWSVTDGDLPTTLTAYRVLRRGGKTPRELISILTYILNARTTNGWGNTYLTAQVLQTLVPDIGLSTIEGKVEMDLLVNGIRQRLPLDSTLTFTAGTQLELQKSDEGIAFVSAYQTYFNPQPVAIDSLFSITTYFTQGYKRVTELKAGEPVTMHVQVDVKRNAEFVMLEVPIPSSCSYVNKQGGYDYYGNNYREHFRQKTAMYFRTLNVGTRDFQIELLPRYTGSYTVNASRMENMYFPVLSGKNEIGRVKVE